MALQKTNLQQLVKKNNNKNDVMAIFKIMAVRQGVLVDANPMDSDGNSIGFEFQSEQEAENAIEKAVNFSIFDRRLITIPKSSELKLTIQKIY